MGNTALVTAASNGIGAEFRTAAVFADQRRRFVRKISSHWLAESSNAPFPVHPHTCDFARGCRSSHRTSVPISPSSMQVSSRGGRESR